MMEKDFIHLFIECGEIYVLLFACCIIGSLVAIIGNIINLSKAKQALSSGQGLKHFKFWPKVLKGIAVLAFLIGIFGSITGFMHTFWTLSVMLEPRPHMAYQGAYESLVAMYFGTAIALCLFVVYYIFRWLLHRIGHPKNLDKK